MLSAEGLHGKKRVLAVEWLMGMLLVTLAVQTLMDSISEYFANPFLPETCLFPDSRFFWKLIFCLPTMAWFLLQVV